MIFLTGAVTGTISVLPYTTGGTWTFQNCPTTVFVNQNNWSNTTTINFTNCVFLGSPTPYWFTNAGSGASGGNPFAGTIKNCIFANFSNIAIDYRTYSVSSSPTVTQCTFYNCTTAFNYTYRQTPATFTGVITQNIFSNCTTAIAMVPVVTTAAVINENLYYSTTNLLNNNSSLYTTLSSVQALGFEVNGGVGNPNFTDTSKNIFYLTQQQPLFPNVAQVGAYPYGYTQGANNNSTGTWNIIAGAGHDNSGWYNPDGNVTKDGTTGNLILSNGTSGVIWSPVVDTGIVGCKTTELDISGIQVYPTNMIDSTLADVRPNYQTSEVRASDTLFNQNDGVLGWTTIKNNIPFTAISGRYIQCRITLVTNDVGA